MKLKYLLERLIIYFLKEQNLIINELCIYIIKFKNDYRSKSEKRKDRK